MNTSDLPKHHRLISSARVILFACFALSLMLVATRSGVQAQSAAQPAGAEVTGDVTKPEPVATTTVDPGIALDDLEIMLEPLTRAEVETEAKGWFALLRAKVSEISVAELAVHRKNREIEQLAKEKAAAETLAEATKDVRSQQSDAEVTAEERAAAAERLAAAQEDLARTVETAQKEGARDQEQATTAANVANTKKAEATKIAAPTSGDSEVTGDVTEVTAAAVQQKAAETGEDKEGVSATQKEASAVNAVELLVEATPDAAKSGTAAAGGGSGPAESADQTSAKAEQLADKADEATGAKTEVKVALVDYSTQLTSERTALADRLKLVLDKWELKGGDPTEYRQYISSLSGFKIDVSDQTATLARAKAWLAADEGGLRWSRNLGIFLGYVMGSIVAAWITRKILRRAMSVTNVSSNLLRDFVVAMSGRAIVFFGVLLGLSALEFNLAPILAAVGAAGFVVAFALQGTLSNFASGLLIMVNKPFDVGDKVDIGSGIKGRVRAVTIFSTMVEADDGLTMIVPNNTVWSGVIVNHSTSTVSNSGATDAATSGEKVL